MSKFYFIVSTEHVTTKISEAILIPDPSYMIFFLEKFTGSSLCCQYLRYQDDVPEAGQFSSTVKLLVPLQGPKQLLNLEASVLQVRKQDVRVLNVTDSK